MALDMARRMAALARVPRLSFLIFTLMCVPCRFARSELHARLTPKAALFTQLLPVPDLKVAHRGKFAYPGIWQCWWLHLSGLLGCSTGCSRRTHLPSNIFYVLTRALRTRAHSNPQHWRMCHMGGYTYEVGFLLGLLGETIHVFCVSGGFGGCELGGGLTSKAALFILLLRPQVSKRPMKLELAQPHMTQKPVLWGEVDARALFFCSQVRSCTQIPEQKKQCS